MGLQVDENVNKDGGVKWAEIGGKRIGMNATFNLMKQRSGLKNEERRVTGGTVAENGEGAGRLVGHC